MSAILSSLGVLTAAVLLAGASQVNASAYIFTDLGTLGGIRSSASDINNSGLVVGFADVTGTTKSHAATWFNGITTDLGELGGGFSGATRVSDQGLIAGFSFDASQFKQAHAVAWDTGGLH